MAGDTQGDTAQEVKNPTTRSPISKTFAHAKSISIVYFKYTILYNSMYSKYTILRRAQ